MQKQTKTKIKTLSFRYLIVITLGSLLLISELFLTIRQSSNVTDYASLINRSGRQRRFSQTIALQSIQFIQEDDLIQKPRRAEDLEQTVNQAKSEYQSIIDDAFTNKTVPLTNKVFALFFADEQSINDKFEQYIQSAERLLNAPLSQHTDTNPDLVYIIENNQQILSAFNDATNEIELSESNVNKVITIFQWSILTLGSIVTIVFWLFVISPLLKSLKEENENNSALSASFKQLTSQLFGVVFQLDIEGNVTYISPNNFFVFGRNEDEVIGKNFVEFAPKESSNQVQEIFSTIVSGKEVRNEKIVILDKKNRHRKVILNAAPMLSDNKVIGVIGVLKDVTEESRQSLELEEEKLRSQILIEKSNLLFYDYDVNSGEISWSGTSFDITGKSIADFQNTNIDQWIEMIHPNDKKQVLRDLDEAEKKISNYNVKYRFRHSDGTYRNIIDRGIFLPNQNKKATRMLGVVIDVTKEEKQTTDLLQSQKQFQNAFKTSSIGFALVGLDGKWLDVNPALTNIVGYSKEDLLKLTFQDITHPDDLEKDLELVDQLVNDEIENYQMEKRYFHSDGHEVWVLLSVSLVKNEKNEPLYFVSQIQDITDQKEFETRMSSLNELKNSFIRTVSHQLRTPLNSIKWNLETLLSGDLGELNKQQEEFIQLTYKAESNVIRTLHDLLVVMDIQERDVSLKKEKVSLDSIITSVISSFEKEAKAKGVKIKFTQPKKAIPQLHIDPQLISESLSQIVRNAIWYSKEGDKVSITLSKNKKGVKLSVKDTGIGIPVDEQRKIFELFYRATNASKMMPDASGVGLTIAKQYVEAHNGEIGLTSEQGKGSTFWIKLPA